MCPPNRGNIIGRSRSLMDRIRLPTGHHYHALVSPNIGRDQFASFYAIHLYLKDRLASPDRQHPFGTIACAQMTRHILRYAIGAIALIVAVPSPATASSQSYQAVSSVSSNVVTPQGQYGNRIPLRLPPGPRGTQPAIELSYASGAPDGLAGPGWGLSGLPAIVRRIGPTARSFGGGDNYAVARSWLGGPGPKALLAPSADPQIPGSYFLSDGEQTRYTPHGTCGDGPCYWMAETATGLTYYFGGDSAQSALMPDGSPDTSFPFAVWEPFNGASLERGIQSWLLLRVEDQYGNGYSCHYSTPLQGQPVRLISSVSYLNGSTSIVFTYELRQPERVQIGGIFVDRPVYSGPFALPYILSTVVVLDTSTAILETLQSLELFYEDSAITSRPLLTHVVEHKGDILTDTFDLTYHRGGSTTDPLSPPEVITTLGSLPLALPQLSNGRTWEIAKGDFNCDGYSDVALAETGRPGFRWLAMLPGARDGLSSAVLFKDTASGGLEATQFRTADANGDGCTDLLIVDFDGGTTNVTTLFGDPSQWWSTSSRDQVAPSPSALVSVLDQNGDGRSDALVVASSTAYLAYGGSSGYLPAAVINLSSGSGNSAVTRPDLNGDDLPDLCTSDLTTGLDAFNNPISAYAATCYLWTGGSYSYAGSRTTRSFDPTTESAAFVVGDFNGDARDDFALVVLGVSTTVEGAFGTSYGLSAFQTAPASQLTKSARVTTGDINGDGLDDLIFATSYEDASSDLVLRTTAVLGAPDGSWVQLDHQDFLLGPANNEEYSLFMEAARYSAKDTVDIVVGLEGVVTSFVGLIRPSYNTSRELVWDYQPLSSGAFSKPRAILSADTNGDGANAVIRFSGSDPTPELMWSENLIGPTDFLAEIRDPNGSMTINYSRLADTHVASNSCLKWKSTDLCGPVAVPAGYVVGELVAAFSQGPTETAEFEYVNKRVTKSVSTGEDIGVFEAIRMTVDSRSIAQTTGRYQTGIPLSAVAYRTWVKASGGSETMLATQSISYVAGSRRWLGSPVPDLWSSETVSYIDGQGGAWQTIATAIDNEGNSTLTTECTANGNCTEYRYLPISIDVALPEWRPGRISVSAEYDLQTEQLLASNKFSYSAVGGDLSSSARLYFYEFLNAQCAGIASTPLSELGEACASALNAGLAEWVEVLSVVDRDTFGNPRTVVDLMGRILTYSSNATGAFLEGVSSASSSLNVVASEFGPFGELLTTISAGGLSQFYSYDGAGRLLDATDQDGVVYIKRAYSNAVGGGFVSTSTAPTTSGDLVVENVFDSTGALRRQTRTGDRVRVRCSVERFHDGVLYAFESVPSSSGPCLEWLGTATDDFGRATRIFELYGNEADVIAGSYVEGDTLVQTIHARDYRIENHIGGSSIQYDLDLAGRVIGVAAPDGALLARSYNLLGLLDEVELGDGERRLYEYDGWGRPIRDEQVGTVDVPQAEGAASWRADGEITQHKAFGEIVDFSHDSMGRVLTRTVQGSGVAETYSYDDAAANAAGLLNEVTTGVWTSSLKYDVAGLVREITEEIDGISRTVTFIRNSDKQLERMEFDDGSYIRVEYDPEGTISLYDWNSPTGGSQRLWEAMDWDGYDRPTQYMTSDGAVTSVGFNARGWRESQDVLSSTGDILFSEAYTHSADGLLSAVAEGRGPNELSRHGSVDTSGDLAISGRDQLGRLGVVAFPGGQATTNFDSYGRLTESDGLSVVRTGCGGATCVSGEVAPGVSSWNLKYDQGLAREWTDTSGGNEYYEYDDYGRMVAVDSGRIMLSYNPSDQVVRIEAHLSGSTVVERRYFGGLLRVIEEGGASLEIKTFELPGVVAIVAEGGIPTQTKAAEVELQRYAPVSVPEYPGLAPTCEQTNLFCTAIVGSCEAGNCSFRESVWMIHLNHRGSPKVVVHGSTGLEVARYAWESFGGLDTARSTGTDFVESSGIGGRRLSGASVLLGRRVFNTKAQLFLQPDPVVPNAHLPTLAYAGYTYAYGMPYRFGDPSGFEPVEAEPPDVDIPHGADIEVIERPAFDRDAQSDPEFALGNSAADNLSDDHGAVIFPTGRWLQMERDGVIQDEESNENLSIVLYWLESAEDLERHGPGILLPRMGALFMRMQAKVSLDLFRERQSVLLEGSENYLEANPLRIRLLATRSFAALGFLLRTRLTKAGGIPSRAIGKGTGGVYVLTKVVKGKRIPYYVGRTVDFARRLAEHKSKGGKLHKVVSGKMEPLFRTNIKVEQVAMEQVAMNALGKAGLINKVRAVGLRNKAVVGYVRAAVGFMSRTGMY